MPDLLIELFSEEIPARMQTRAAEDLKKRMTDGLVEAGLTYAGAAGFSTPRRLTLAVDGLLAASPTVRGNSLTRFGHHTPNVNLQFATSGARKRRAGAGRIERREARGQSSRVVASCMLDVGIRAPRIVKGRSL